MAYVNTTRTTHSRDTGVMAGLRTRFEAWKVYRRTRAELDNLSDRELADLGLHRSGIPAIARETAYGV